MFDEFDLKFLISTLLNLLHWGDYGTAIIFLVLIVMVLIRRSK